MMDFTHIVSSDEVGLGSLAGPLCIGVVCAPHDWVGLPGLTDSKDLSWSELKRLAAEFWALKDPNIQGQVYTYDVEAVDRKGISKLLPWAHGVAIEEMTAICRDSMGGTPKAIVDGTMKIPGALSMIKADRFVKACSMASVIAKVHHDQLMVEFAATYPGYDFENCVGYTSPKHTAGLEKLGPCELHRKSFSTYDKYRKDPEEPRDMWAFLDDE